MGDRNDSLDGPQELALSRQLSSSMALSPGRSPLSPAPMLADPRVLSPFELAEGFAAKRMKGSGSFGSTFGSPLGQFPRSQRGCSPTPRTSGRFSPAALGERSPGRPLAICVPRTPTPTMQTLQQAHGKPRPPPIRTIMSNESLGSTSPDKNPRSSGPVGASTPRSSQMWPPTPGGGRGDDLGSPLSWGVTGFRAQRRQRAPEISEVASRLFIGTEVAASSLDTLRERGITHVLNTSQLANFHEEEVGASGEPLVYLKLGLTDSTADLPRMHTALASGVDFIERALASPCARVLVHCHRGISRSCALAMAYLIKAERKSAEEVFSNVRRARRVCDPNLGYWCCLKEWERLTLRTGGSSAAGAASTPPSPAIGRMASGGASTPGRSSPRCSTPTGLLPAGASALPPYLIRRISGNERRSPVCGVR